MQQDLVKLKNQEINSSKHQPLTPSIIETGLNLITETLHAINNLSKSINYDYKRACQLIINCTSRVVITGMGKSGHIGNKIAATLASTGTPSFFMHPAEAAHGDLGMLTKNDLIIALSNSGETSEILTITPHIKRKGIKVIAITSNHNSSLAKVADIHLPIHVDKEACPLGLAPTTSTTATLVLGDAISVSVLKARGFTTQDFATSHPGGSLGRALLTRVKDIMHANQQIPKVASCASVAETIVEMTNKRLGFVCIMDKQDLFKIVGVFTDGDLRRAIEDLSDIHQTPIAKLMSKNFQTIKKDVLASEAITILEKYKISALPVLDDDDKLCGAFNMHDLLSSGVI